MSHAIVEKICTSCKKLLLATPDYFYLQKRRNPSKPSRLMSQCKECIRAKKIARYAANPEPVRKKERKRYQKKKTTIAVQRKARYWKNPEKYRANTRAWAAVHSEEKKQADRLYNRKNAKILRKKKRTYYLRNRPTIAVKTKAYVQQHPEKYRIIKQRHKALKRQLPHTFTEQQWHYALQYWGYACAVCGNQQGFLWTLSMDHFIPLSDPDCPGTVAENILPLCFGDGGCNNSKRHTPPAIWLEQRLGKAKARKKLKEIAAYFAHVLARQDEG